MKRFPSAAILPALTLAILATCPSPAYSQSTDDCQALKPPLAAVFFADKSGSANANRTPEPTYNMLEEIVEHIATNGGTMGIGITDTNSNEPLLRLDIATPAACPQKPGTIRNPFLANEKKKEYLKLKRAYDEHESKRRKAIESKITDFKHKVEKLLSGPRSARSTDIWGSIRRGELLQNEPSFYGVTTVRRFIVLISDGEHTKSSSPPVAPPLKSGAALITVNGTPADVKLDPFKPLHFESVPSAIRYIVNQ